MAQTMEGKRVALVDLSGVFRMYWHAMENEEISAAVNKTVAAVVGFLSGYDFGAVCVDCPPYIRTTLLPSYKANREKAPAALFDQLGQTKDILDADGVHIFGAQGYEADDILAQLAGNYSDNGATVDVYSADKDLLQIVTGDINVISTATRQKYTPDAVREKFGVDPDQVPDLLALIGDKSDNIVGIKGVGVKTAAAWISEAGSLGAILAKPEALPEKYARFVSVISDGKEQISKNYKLVQLLTDAPNINPEEIMETKERRTLEPVADDIEPEVIEAPKPQPVAQVSTLAPMANDTTPAPIAWDKSLEPRDPTQAYKLAKLMFSSRVFGDFPNPEAILAVVLTGRAHGLDSVASLQGFHVIKGKVAPSAQLLIGLVKKHPTCEYMRLVESTTESATWETKRVDEPEPTRLAYTFAQAKLAGLTGNDNWRKRPDTMLRWRAGVELARAVYPDVVSGLYSVEEMRDETDAVA